MELIEEMAVHVPSCPREALIRVTGVTKSGKQQGPGGKGTIKKMAGDHSYWNPEDETMIEATKK